MPQSFAALLGLILPSTGTLLWGAIAYLVIVSGLIGGTVLLATAVARRVKRPTARPPCQVGPLCPCDCHVAG